MRIVGTEQQQIDQAVVTSIMTDYRSKLPETEWSRRYYAAADRVTALYDEFVPDVHPTARSFGQLLGGGVMAFLEMRYGPDEHAPKLYSGYYEKDVLALQHSAAHSWRFMRNMFRYAVVKNEQTELDDEGYPYYDDDFFLRVPLIAGCHDSVMGNDRGNDERQAALFGGTLMSALGGTLLPDKSVMAAIEATTWDEQRQRQLTYEGEDYPRYRVAAKVADLLSCNDKLGPYESLCVFQENLTKRFKGRILTLEAERRGFDLVAASMEERMEFMDGSDVLRKAMDVSLDRQVELLRGLPFADPSMESAFPGRLDNADFTAYLRDEYQGRVITNVQLLHETRAYAGAA